jgi:hypothetical protein
MQHTLAIARPAFPNENSTKDVSNKPITSESVSPSPDAWDAATTMATILTLKIPVVA